MQRLIAAALLAASLIASALPAAAEQDPTALTMAEAALLAVKRQPGLDAYDYAALAAREAAVADNELPDPIVSIGAQSVPLSGDGRLRLDGDDMTMATVGVMQEMVRPEKRRAAASRSRAESEQFALEREALALQVIRDAKLAWVEAFEAARRASLYHQTAKELAAERQVSAQRISSGAVQPSEVFQLDTAIANIDDERIQADNVERQARAKLARWIGDAALRPLSDAAPIDAAPIEASIDEAPLREGVLAGHPRLAMQRKAIDVARFEADGARAARTPDWSWQLMYGYRQDDRSDLISLQVAMPLQIDRANRQDRRVAEKLALVERARAMAVDVERELRADLMSVRADLDTAQARLKVHRQREAAAVARVRTAQAAYRAGTLPLTGLWEARRGVLDARVHHATIHAELLRAAARLQYLVGETQ